LLMVISVIFGSPGRINAQELLDEKVTVNFKNVRLADVLNEIGRQAGFYFSFNGRLLSRDSLVTISTSRQPVYSVLEHLFHGKYDYTVQQRYLIISSARPHLSIIHTDITNDRNVYSVSGVVVDENTGERLMNASVYAREQLVATLTDEHGYFKLKFRTGDGGAVNITASKMAYQDASLNLLRSVEIESRSQIQVYKKAVQSTKGVEHDAFGRLFISAKQQLQNLNLPDFFAAEPFQFSVAPGLSTHGLMSSHVINEFSVNVIGGYTAGVNGIEIGGLFNIDKGSSKYLQVAGIFNLVGGSLVGFQFAGLNNKVLDSVKGLQIAGLINKAYGPVSGLQISGFNNVAHKLKGVQIGLVNVADSSAGASIGVLNIIRNGFYKVSLSANNLTNTNISLATGTHQFYSILHLGANIEKADQLYAVGLGLGHDFMWRNRLYVAASADYLFAYTGKFDNRWAQAKLLMNIPLGKKAGIFAGPVFNRYSSSGSLEGYKIRFRKDTDVPLEQKITRNWLGWEAGIAFSSMFSPRSKL